MAFPSTITTNDSTAYHGVGGPFISSTGSVFVVIRDPSTTANAVVFKASDPSSSWAAVDSVAVTSGNTIRHLNAFQVGDNLHIVTRDAASASTNQIRYHVFSMASDTFTTENELVKTTYTTANTVDESFVGIVVRSDGSVIVLYEGPQVLADIQRSRVYYARKLAGAWSADFAIGGTGNNHWYAQEIVLGSQDRTHFFVANYTLTDLYQQCLTSANALETLPAAFDTTVLANDGMGMQRPVAFSASAGGTVIRYPYYDTFDPSINSVLFSSQDVPTYTVSADITGATNPLAEARRRVMSFAVNGDKVYATFADSASDLTVMSAQDVNGWAAPSVIATESAGYIFSNAYTRGAAVVNAIVYTSDGNGLRYTEYTISAVAVAGNQPLLTMSMLGVGR